MSDIEGGSMRSLHLNGNDPSPPLSMQAVQSTHGMHPNQSFPSHRLPARSVQRVLKECAGKELLELKYGKKGKPGKGNKGNKGTKGNGKKKGQGGKKKKNDGMLGSMYLGTAPGSGKDSNPYLSMPPTPKEILTFLKSIKTEDKEMPDGE